MAKWKRKALKPCWKANREGMDLDSSGERFQSSGTTTGKSPKPCSNPSSLRQGLLMQKGLITLGGMPAEMEEAFF